MGKEGIVTPPLAWVVLGAIGRPHGLRGWVHFYPQTDDLEALLAQPNWQLTWPTGQVVQATLLQGQVQGRGLLLHFEGYTDRDLAQRLTGALAAIPRDAFPAPEEGAFYWVDLIGLEAVTQAGTTLGTITELYDNGAHDVVLLTRSDQSTQALPFVWGDTVLSVDQSAGRVIFDWSPNV